MKHRLVLIALVSALLFTCAAVTEAQAQAAQSGLTPVAVPSPPVTPKDAAHANDPPTQPPLEGTYDVAVAAKGQEGALPLTLLIKRVGEKLSAESTGSDYITINGIKVDGENVTLSAAFQGFPFEMLGRLKEGGMTGTWQGGPNEGTWSAKRHQEKKGTN